MSEEGLLVRNIHWLFFLAGIILASEISLIDGFVKLFGDWYTVGYLIVGLGIMMLVKIMGRLIPSKNQDEEEGL